MMEPFYIRQTADVQVGDEGRRWFEAAADEAKAEGARLCRFSVRDGVHLIEGWREQLHEIGDQGEPRFYYASNKEGGKP